MLRREIPRRFAGIGGHLHVKIRRRGADLLNQAAVLLHGDGITDVEGETANMIPQGHQGSHRREPAADFVLRGDPQTIPVDSGGKVRVSLKQLQGGFIQDAAQKVPQGLAGRFFPADRAEQPVDGVLAALGVGRVLGQAFGFNGQLTGLPGYGQPVRQSTGSLYRPGGLDHHTGAPATEFSLSPP